MCIGPVGLETHNVVEGGNCFLTPALIQKREAKIQLGPGTLRMKGCGDCVETKHFIQGRRIKVSEAGSKTFVEPKVARMPLARSPQQSHEVCQPAWRPPEGMPQEQQTGSRQLHDTVRSKQGLQRLRITALQHVPELITQGIG